MKLVKKQSGRFTYLYAVKSFRNNKGRGSTKIIEKFGTIEELREQLNGEDPIEWAKAKVAQMTKKEKEEKKTVVVNLSPTLLLNKDTQNSYNGGFLFLQKIYYDLGLHTICKSISEKHDFKYDLNSILSRLLYSRIMYPASKLATCDISKKYIEQPNFDLHQIYRTLSVLAEESDNIQASVYKNSLKKCVVLKKVYMFDTNITNCFQSASGLQPTC